MFAKSFSGFVMQVVALSLPHRLVEAGGFFWARGVRLYAIARMEINHIISEELHEADRCIIKTSLKAEG